MRHIMSSLVRGCGVLALAAATLAGAQIANAQSITPPAQGALAAQGLDQSSSETATGSTAPAQTTDIVVTANRRVQRLQEVPIAVTVVDGNQLTRQNVNNVEDLTRSAPALTTSGQPGSNSLSVRGIGALSFSRTSEGSVGVVVDGVALANTSTNPPQLFDVSRAEVLEGPQGTLFGRNASAGVLNITTNAPNPTKIEIIGHADVGSHGTYVGRGVVNLQDRDNAALRVSGSYAQDPWTSFNVLDGTYKHRVAESLRGRFLWKPTNRITLNIIGDYNNTQNDGGGEWTVFASTPGSLLTKRLTNCGVTINADNYKSCNDQYSRLHNKTYGSSVQGDLDLGFATLTSISAYRYGIQKGWQDLDSSPVYRLNQYPDTTTKNFSQELRLASASGGLADYVLGLYYFHSKVSSDLLQIGPVLTDLGAVGACPLPTAALCALPLGQTLSTRARISSYAAFGEATIHATRQLRIILGGRVGHEDVYAHSFTVTAPGAIAALAAGPDIVANPTDTYFSYRVGVQFDVMPNLMVYGTYTRGYKGPAVNDQATSTLAPFVVRPEIPKAGEIGFKSSFANGRASLDVAAFHTSVDNFQAQVYNPATASFSFQNASVFTSKGVTATLFGRPFEGLTGSVGVSYINTRYGRGFLIQNSANQIVDAHDYPLGYKFRLTASGEYSTHVTDSVDGFIQADVVNSPTLYSDGAKSAILKLRGSTLVGGRIGARLDGGRFGISAYVRNIFDTRRPAGAFQTPVASLQFDNASFSQFYGPEARRTIGGSVDVRF